MSAPASFAAPVALATEGLTKVYGKSHTEVVALRDATVRVHQGEVVALLGPSGAGKSTFLLCVGLIQAPTAGRVVIGGQMVVVDLRRNHAERNATTHAKASRRRSAWRLGPSAGRSSAGVVVHGRF